MPNIIPIKEWSEWEPVVCEGYSLTGLETVQDAIDQFVKHFGYQPDRVWVKGNQVRIEKREDK